MEEKDAVELREEVSDGNNDDNAAVTVKDGGDKKSVKKKLIYLFTTVGLSALFCSFYYCSMMVQGLLFPIVMFTYMTVLTVLMLVYIVYNRGFSRKGVTMDMLPPEWTDEQKREFIESGEKRLQRSKWMLVFIIAILFTFIVEALVLFVF